MNLENSLSALRGHAGHRCPFWFGWALLSPLRQLVENPEKLLGPLVSPQSQVLEVGPGMGFFTTFLAERVGPTGRVHCVDVEERMLKTLGKRLARRGLAERVSLRHCGAHSLGLDDLHGTVDIAVLIHVLHEIPNPGAALLEIANTLKPEGRLLLIEPPGHVNRKCFDSEIAMAKQAGLEPVEPPPGWLSRRLSVVLGRRSR